MDEEKAERNLSADEMPVYNTSIDDIDEQIFSDYFKRAIKEQPNIEFANDEPRNQFVVKISREEM